MIDLSILQTLHSDDDRCEIEIEDVGSFSCDRNGIIRDHGKFEGQDILLPLFWDLACQGFSDAEVSGDVYYYFFCLEEGDTQAIDRLGKEFALWETGSGFVYFCPNDTGKEFHEWVEDIESEYLFFRKKWGNLIAATSGDVDEEGW